MTKEEIRAMIQEEISAAQAQKVRQRSMCQIVMDGFTPRIERAAEKGNIHPYKVTNAIYAILRTVFGVKYVNDIDVEKEPEMRKIVGKIVGLIEEGQA